MKKLMDLENNKEAVKFLVLSRKGNKTAQKHLYCSLIDESRIIQRHYYYCARHVGLNLSDLDEEFIYCFMQLLEHYNESKGSVIGFFRCLYFNRVRNVIKRAYGVTRRRETLAIGVSEDLFENENNLNFNYEDENKKRIDDEDLSRLILGPESNIITQDEKIIYDLYLRSYSFKDMSKIAKMKYGDCIKKFKSGKQKIALFLKTIPFEEE